MQRLPLCSPSRTLCSTCRGTRSLSPLGFLKQLPQTDAAENEATLHLHPENVLAACLARVPGVLLLVSRGSFAAGLPGSAPRAAVMERGPGISVTTAGREQGGYTSLHSSLEAVRTLRGQRRAWRSARFCCRSWVGSRWGGLGL